MKNVNYFDSTNKETPYFTNKNKAIDIKKESNFCTYIYQFDEEIGDGHFKKIEAKDFSIEIIDVKLKKDLIIKTQTEEGFLEFSHLIEGKQKIKTNSKISNFIYEANQSYLVFLDKFIGTYSFSKSKHFKEIRIRISNKMIDFLELKYEEFSIHKIEDTFIKKTDEKINHLLIQLIENKLTGINKSIYMKSKITEILSIYLSTESSKSPYSTILESVKSSKKIIKKNINKQFTSKLLAKELQINETELKLNFKNTTGLSIQKFSMKIKMEKAKKLLKLTEIPIYQIADEIGYKNATHFTNAFKKHTNVLPKKYRTDLNLE